MAPREFLFITTSSIWTDVFANDTEALLLQISWAVNGWGLWCPFSSLHVLSFPFNSFSSLQFPLISFHSFHFLSFRFIAFRFLSFPHFLSFLSLPFIAFHFLSFPFIAFHFLSCPCLLRKYSMFLACLQFNDHSTTFWNHGDGITSLSIDLKRYGNRSANGWCRRRFLACPNQPGCHVKHQLCAN